MGKLITLEDTNKKKFEVVNKSSSTAEFIIYSAIGESLWEDSVSAKDISDAIKDLPSNVSQIDVRLNSPGGSVFDGITIYERLKQHKANITVYVDGLAASIASIIMLAGDEVVMGEGAQVMIHKPMVGVCGNSQELERMIVLLDKIESQMLGIYARKTGMTRLEVSQMLDSGDTWFTAEEAVESGFADSIVGNANLKLVASMLDKADWIKQKPTINPVNQSVAKKAVSERLEQMQSFLARKKGAAKLEE